MIFVDKGVSIKEKSCSRDCLEQLLLFQYSFVFGDAPLVLLTHI